MRTAPIPTVVTLVAALAWPAGLGVLSAVAAEGTPCVAEWEATISPGITMSPGRGKYSSNGETGTLTCDGTVDGVAVTGPGTWGVSGTYDATDCINGQGPIRFTWTIPTAGGVKQGVTSGEFDFGIRHGRAPLNGRMQTDRASGSWTMLPLKGDCVVEPVTVVRLTFDLLLRS